MPGFTCAHRTSSQPFIQTGLTFHFLGQFMNLQHFEDGIIHYLNFSIVQTVNKVTQPLNPFCRVNIRWFGHVLVSSLYCSVQTGTHLEDLDF